MKKICLISDSASHYRELIYKLMDEQLDCTFIFGSGLKSIKTFNTSVLRNAKEVVAKNQLGGRCYKIPNLISLTRGYDVIVDDTGILCTSSWLLAFISHFRRQKVYLWGHGWYGREGFVKKYLKRVYSALTNGMFVYGQYANNLMIENGFNPQKLHVIHNSLDYDLQLKLRKEISENSLYKEHFGNNNPVLIMIGRLNFRKHLDLLVDAVAILKKKEKIFNVVLIGSGEDESKIKHLVTEKGLEDQVWFYGACYDEKKNAELIYNADMCVVPGDIGLTAIHSMMFGCPCLTHDYYPNQGPEFESIIQGETGCFYHFKDVKSLCETINAWFDDKKDCRDAVRLACYKEVDENWNPHKQINIIKSVILVD